MDDQEKTLVERLEIWIDKPENWIKVFPCVLCLFLLMVFSCSTSKGAIASNMLANGYSLQEAMSPIELVASDESSWHRYDIYRMHLTQQNGEEQVLSWRVDYWPRTCHAIRLK